MNDDIQSNLLKTCASCGQKKPLADFRQMSATGGIAYGNICSSCRQINKKNKASISGDGSSGGSTEHKIDIKALLQRSIDQNEIREEKKDAHEEERDTKESIQVKQQEKRSDIAQKEQQHRGYLKQMSFHGAKTQSKTPPPGQPQAATEKQLETSAREETFVKEEKNKTEIDTTNSQENVFRSGNAKLNSSARSSFLKWLGDPIGKTAIAQNVQEMSNENKSPNGPGRKK